MLFRKSVPYNRKDVLHMTLEIALIDRLDLEQDNTLVLVDGRYEIAGFEIFKKKIDEVLKYLSEHEYTEEDRKSLAGARAAVNKYSSNINEKIKTRQNEMFGVVDQQKKEVQSLLNSVTSALKSHIDEADRIARLRKQEIFEKEIMTESEYIPELADLDVFDIIDASWLNRSASDKKNLQELHSRMNSITKLVRSDLCKSSDVSEICGILQLHDWSELDTIQFIDAKYAPIEEVDEESHVEEKVEVVEEVEELEVVSLEIKSKDFARMLEILKVSGIQYRII